jgi:hypothetical protein
MRSLGRGGRSASTASSQRRRASATRSTCSSGARQPPSACGSASASRGHPEAPGNSPRDSDGRPAGSVGALPADESFGAFGSRSLHHRASRPGTTTVRRASSGDTRRSSAAAVSISVVSLREQAATALSHGPGSNGGQRAPPLAVQVSLPRAWPIPRVPDPRAAPRTAGAQSSRASRNPSAPIPLRGQRRSPRRAYTRVRPAPRKRAQPALPALLGRAARAGAEPNARRLLPSPVTSRSVV